MMSICEIDQYHVYFVSVPFYMNEANHDFRFPESPRGSLQCVIVFLLMKTFIRKHGIILRYVRFIIIIIIIICTHSLDSVHFDGSALHSSFIHNHNNNQLCQIDVVISSLIPIRYSELIIWCLT